MSDKEKYWEDLLDEATGLVRDDKLAPRQVEAMAARVRDALPGVTAAIRTCTDFQALIPDFLAGRLSKGRTLLLEEHTRECIPCRKALTSARTTSSAARPARPAYRTSPWLRWGGVAAGVVMAFLLLQLGIRSGWVPVGSGSVVALESSRGMVFTVDGDELVPLAVGDSVRSNRPIRTGKGGGAILRMEDGSLVELAERTELAFESGWTGRTVRLARGDVIVEAADQGSGRLYVETDDCQVAVKGTVFSVSYGVKGSRVSVIEGEVWVAKGGENTVLQAGQQFSSRPLLVRTPLRQEFAWSQDSARHLAVLDELTTLHRDLTQASFGDHLRYSSDLIGYLPAETVVYAALPNISGRLDEAYQAFRLRTQENPALREWLESKTEGSETLANLDELVLKLRSVGAALGDEVVLAFVAGIGAESERGAPLLIAPVIRPGELKEFLWSEAERINLEAGEHGPVLHVLEEPGQADADARGLKVYVGEGLVVVTPSAELLIRVAGGPAGTSLADTDFFQTLVHSYSGGVDWLLAMDLSRLPSSLEDGREGKGPAEVLRTLGVSQVQDLVVERKQENGVAENRAVLTYEGETTGLMSWIAQPGPMGALDLVSPEANLAAAFVVNNPARMVDEIFDQIAQTDSQALADLQAFEVEHGFSIRQDIAEPLGGEFVFALDGPILPTPSWKMIVEVYQPDVLQRTIERLVAEINRYALAEGDPGVSLTAHNSGGTAVFELRFERTGTSIYYRYVRGYLVAAPDPALITQAVQFRAAGYTLASSSRFTALLPRDTQVNLSGFFYQNLAPLAEPLLSSGLAESLGDAGAVIERIRSAPPILVGLYAEPGRVTVAGGGDLESFWLNSGTLGVLGGRQGIARLIQDRTDQ